MKKIVVLGCLSFLPYLNIFAQNRDIYPAIKEKFPDQPAVFLECNETVNIIVQGDTLSIFSDVSEDLLLMKEQSEWLSDKRVYGSHFTQVTDLKAKTLIWDKNRYKEMNVSDFKKNSDQADGVFYDDSYYYSFYFPSVTERNRTHLQYRELHKDARFLSGYIFPKYFPMVKSSFTIKTSPGVELAFKVLHDNQNLIQFRKTEKGGYVYYEWIGENLPAIKRDEESPSIRYYEPHLVYYIKSYTTKKGKRNVLNSLDDLHNWYYSFIKNLNKDESEQLKKVVADIKSMSTSEIDFVKNVYYWVQDNIQYIAFEQGMRGLIPHSGSYVCEKRYGDCKDMANLIVNLLSLGNVKAYHTWIGTRDLPYNYTDIPTPIVDNHMIATYKAANGDLYFLDATSDHTPFGFPSSMIQGKEALINLSADKYEVVKVPVISKEKNVMVDSMRIRIENNFLVGEGIGSVRGYPKVIAGYQLNRTKEDDVKKYVTKLIGKGSNKFFLDNYAIKNLNERSLPTSINYSFRIADYFQQIGNELYLNLNLNKDFYNNYLLESRKTPLENDYQYEKNEYITITIPEGYQVDYLPPNAKYDSPLMGFDISYAKKGTSITLTKKVYVNYLLLAPSQFEQWNEAVRNISKAYKETIIFKKR